MDVGSVVVTPSVVGVGEGVGGLGVAVGVGVLSVVVEAISELGWLSEVTAATAKITKTPIIACWRVNIAMTTV